MHKRGLALLLALAMSAALFPAAALAAMAGVTGPVAEAVVPDGSPAPDDAPAAESPEADGGIGAALTLDRPAVHLSASGIAPVAIDSGATDAEKVKEYFVSGQLTGAYVTQRHTEGQSDTAWSVMIGEDGDVSLLYDGEDTGATATFNSVTSAGKPGAIVFHRAGWYADEAGEA